MELCSYIRTVGDGIYPVGMVCFAPIDHQSSEWVKADGRYLSVDAYHELFEVIGNRYCKPILREEVPPGFIERLRRAIPLKPRVEYVEVENPEYRKGYFRLPQLVTLDV